MPLEELAPSIDDRRFDDIVSELRTRIEHYTPEWQPVWTDENHSDPGITLIHLFAWLGDMLLYRLGKVPDLNYIKFLELLGIELLPAQPASAELTFAVRSGHDKPYVLIPGGTQVAAQGETALLVFETEKPLYALRARLAAVQAHDGFTYRPATQANENLEGFAPFGSLAEAGSALVLGFDSDGDLPAIELDLTVWVPESAGAIGYGDCAPSQARRRAPADLRWEYWDGSQWKALKLLSDQTDCLTRSGHVLVKLPSQGTMARHTLPNTDKPLYWIRARLESSRYEKPPIIRGVRTNTVAVRQAQTVREEILGGSNGRPNQTLSLESTPVLAGSLILEIDEGNGEGWRRWQPVGDFHASGSDDRHFMLNRTTGEIRFGDGRRGRIPASNVSNPGASIIAREYRFGGGRNGNVAAGKINNLLTGIAGIDVGTVANLLPAIGGRDEESLAAAKERAPGSLKSKGRAVTEEDFEHLAMQAGNIKRAKALPLLHPDFPGTEIPGVVTLLVVPETDEPNPLPKEATLRRVCDYLRERRLLTTELYVGKPCYRHVEVRARIVVADGHDAASVMDAIEKSLDRYFHPLKGGEDDRGWPFGGAIYFSLVYRRVLSVTGVLRVERLQLVVDGELVPECRDVELARDELTYATGHAIEQSLEVAYGG